jgi:hypothetical protein
MSHHRDCPTVRQNIRLDVTDRYVFRGETGTVFVMDTCPSIAGEDTALMGHHPEARYVPCTVGTPAVYGFAQGNGRSLTDNAPDVMFSPATNTAFTIGLTKHSAGVEPTRTFPYVSSTA